MISHSDQKMFFWDSISEIEKSTTTEVFSSKEIQEKTRQLLSPKPPKGKEHSKWHRLQQCYTTVSLQNSHVLYLRGKNEQPNQASGSNGIHV